MPFTETKTPDNRIVKYVEYKTLKDKVRASANDILQLGHDKALALAAEQYSKLRLLMMKQFDNIDVKLAEFEEELTGNLLAQRGETEKLKEYRQVLEWVKKFQEALGRILDLEA